MNDINRRFFSPEQKVAILREHLVEGRAVSDLCETHRIHPTVFYQWQRQFFENGTAAFKSKQSRSRVSDGYQKKIEALEQKLQRKNEVLSELLEEHTRLKKRTWGDLTALWVAHDVRDAIMDFIAYWSERTEINALVPRDHWLEPWEKVAIISFHHQFPLEGYRRLTFMMLDRNVVAVSPSSTYRVLKAAGLLQRWNPKASRKGNGVAIATGQLWNAFHNCPIATRTPMAQECVRRGVRDS